MSPTEQETNGEPDVIPRYEMSSLIEKVADALREADEAWTLDSECVGGYPDLARAAIQVVLRKMLERLVNETPFEDEGFYAYEERIKAKFYVRQFAKYHHIDLSESKP